MVQHFSYLAKIVNVETAFLYGDLEEEIYMECPQGMHNVKKDDCIILNKCIYELVQAARQYDKKVVKILRNSGFIKGSINLCLYVKKIVKGFVCVALCIDDNLMIDNMAAIDDALEALKKGWCSRLWKGCRITCPVK